MKGRFKVGKRQRGPDIKKVQKEGFKIIFLDESGISQNPYPAKTWGIDR
ncbi:hypothetical protein LEP1GSC045_0018 [Leptospira interrogans serovar Pomona str. Kennewicki LC82-25]|nr:hypothetical protein LEP1GSC045_0018 [Leptospira interrogans serovar Pomona str. Kennewicki LC82-25]EKN96380.1 hypothetical protein LEP1GSC014_0785 [Leptospira interrogans serovar Pomona str. Pomona]EMF34381.1 hypothetical protein LEP1GSC201_0394 [Leptospira interrogans serovar Pomona str. Fox 32256]EMI62070.1 hypothetical protein LEP1GSC200_0721 [Leptospira interrogans serovar Pomona str. CSL10083]EMJ64031.1 hypothetical protein LEP1GSC197_1094 [Leptospira interrogans serovar Pomona str. CS